MPKPPRNLGSNLTTKKSALATAQANLKASKDEAQNVINQGSLGFFKKMGSEYAVEILTTPQYTENGVYMSGDTHMGRAGDATSLENMYQVMKYIKETSDLRVANGDKDHYAVDPLSVSDELMALAQVNGNWSRILDRGHSGNFGAFIGSSGLGVHE